MKHTHGRPKIGLALGSGGARGLSIAGILGILEEEGIEIDYIAGASIGAMIGALYATGMSSDQIKKVITDTDNKRILSLLDPGLDQGLIGGLKVKNFFAEHLGDKRFEDCRLPFRAVATDLKTGEVVVYKKGELVPAIRASISIPFVFKPAEYEGRTLIDGGLSMPVPVDLVRKMGADIVIAVNADNHYFLKEKKLGFSGIADNSITILRYHLARYCVRDADIVISPEIGRTRWHQFTEGKRLIKAGEEMMREKMPELKKIIRKKTAEQSMRRILNKKLF
jgi:NTE family protein